MVVGLVKIINFVIFCVHFFFVKKFHFRMAQKIVIKNCISSIITWKTYLKKSCESFKCISLAVSENFSYRLCKPGFEPNVFNVLGANYTKFQLRSSLRNYLPDQLLIFEEYSQKYAPSIKKIVFFEIHKWI